MKSIQFNNSVAFASFLWLVGYASIIGASLTKEQVQEEVETTCSISGLPGEQSVNPSCLEHQKLRVPDDCQLVYAKVPESFDGDNIKRAQWATYTLTPRKKGTPVRQHGDIVIQWTDPIPESLNNQDEQIHGRMLRQYTWNGQETGGNYEGETWVESVITGLGMTARSTTVKNGNNILPLVPRVDEGSLTRFNSPGAGSVTRYHNFTWWYTKDVKAGDELLFSSEGKMASLEDKPMVLETISSTVSKPLSLEYLKANGFCLDNMRPRKSRIKEAGRGAFATRDLVEGSIVAPVPVALVHRDELDSKLTNQQDSQQLLLNYCFGDESSDWLLFPYSPVVNLVNHYNEPNVKLRWSSASMYDQKSQKMKPGMTNLLELVATRPIKMGEEIYLDYGRAWEDSWWKHVQEIWKPNSKHYTPSYVMDDAIKIIRTESEQKEHPYPKNLFTSCFYR